MFFVPSTTRGHGCEVYTFMWSLSQPVRGGGRRLMVWGINLIEARDRHRWAELPSNLVNDIPIGPRHEGNQPP